MAFSRRLGVVGIAAASWLVAVGCDDDEDQVRPSSGAGEAGEAPIAGKSSVAGSQNNGGKAGSSAGTAGQGGTASGNAGAAGEGGASGAGQAGSGETAGAGGGGGALGGAGGAGGAAGGQAGQAGQGGEGGVLTAAAPHCSFTCVSDDDCVVDGDDSIKCNLTTHACEDPTTACTVDANCLVSLSFWFKPCTDDSACTANTEACVAADGQGFCATLPEAGDPACDGSNVAKTLPRFGAQGTVSVCAHPDARCFSGVCRPGCGTPNVGCGIGNGDTCSTATGLCECTSGTECTATGICRKNGQCQECVTNEECAENVTDTVCVGGKCGCATADACSAIDPGYTSAPAACE
jgi:hypothetical protein